MIRTSNSDKLWVPSFHTYVRQAKLKISPSKAQLSQQHKQSQSAAVHDIFCLFPEMMLDLGWIKYRVGWDCSALLCLGATDQLWKEREEIPCVVGRRTRMSCIVFGVVVGGYKIKPHAQSKKARTNVVWFEIGMNFVLTWVLGQFVGAVINLF